MTEREKLEVELHAADTVLRYLNELSYKAAEQRNQVVMNLNRARRLEREELQNAKTSGD